MVFDILSITTEEIKKALEAMQRGKAAGKGQVIADMLKNGGQIVLEKPCHHVFTMRHDLERTGILKECNIISIHKKAKVKDLKNYGPISLLCCLQGIYNGNR